jgi:hypothetical protein
LASEVGALGVPWTEPRGGSDERGPPRAEESGPWIAASWTTENRDHTTFGLFIAQFGPKPRRGLFTV